MKIRAIDYSPIKGPEGNIEYLIYFTKDKNFEENFTMEQIEELVEKAHKNLNGE